MGFELRKRGVTSVSLWPGAVQTELVNKFVLDTDATRSEGFQVDSSNTQLHIHCSFFIFLKMK